MKPKTKLILTSLTLLLVVLLNIAPRGEQVAVPAECNICLCINAPTCTDLVAPVYGLPFMSAYGPVDENYVSKEYRTSSININMLGVSGNSIIAVGFMAIAIYIIHKKNANSRH